VLFAGFSHFSRPAQGQEPQPAPGSRLTLEQCIAVALENQPAIQALQKGVAIADEQERIAQSYFYPHIDVTARLTQLNKHIYVLTPVSGQLADVLSDAAAFFGLARQISSAAAMQALSHPNGPVFSAAKETVASAMPLAFQTNILGDRFLVTNVLLTQPIYTGGKILLQNQRARLGVQAAEEEVVKSRQQTAFEVSRAYFGILLTRQLLAVVDETIARFEAMETVARNLARNPDQPVSNADVQRLHSLVELGKSQRAQFLRDAEFALAGLRTAMGLEIHVTVEPAEPLEYRPASPDLAGLLSRALQQRPELAKVRLGLRNAELERELAIAQFRPDVGLFGQFTAIHDDAGYLNPTNPDMWAGGIQASMPLFEGGRRLAARRQAEIKYAQVQDYLRFLEQGITLEVQKAYLEHQATADRIGLAKEALDSAQKSYQGFRFELLSAGLERKNAPKVDTGQLLLGEKLISTRLLLSAAEVEYAHDLYANNLALAALRLVTGSNERQPLPETGVADPGAGPAPASDGRGP
jgi:outer membrane protein TolC